MKQVDLGFTFLEIYNRYAIVRTNEGMDVTLDNHLQMKDVVEREITARTA